MLTTLFATIIAKCMPIIHLDIVNKRFDAFLASVLMCVIIYILFKIGGAVFYKDKASKRYEEIYDEPVMNFLRIIFVVINMLTIAKIYDNMSNGMPSLNKTIIFILMLIALDVATTIAGYLLYSFDEKEAIIDGFMLQLKNVSITFLMLAIILVILKLTIFGFVLVAMILISIFIRK